MISCLGSRVHLWLLVIFKGIRFPNVNFQLSDLSELLTTGG